MRIVTIAKRVLASSGGMLIAAACSGGGAQTTAFAVPATMQSQSIRQMSSLEDAGQKIACPNDRIYVADYYVGDIEIYSSTPSTKPVPCGRITHGVLGPSGISVDANGTLYVSDYRYNGVTEYKKNTTSPSLIVPTNGQPQYAYVGADGTLYVPESYSNQIEEFLPGAKTPVRTISLTYPWGVATDRANNLYATSDVYNNGTYTGHVIKFAPGATTGTDLGITVGFTFDIALTKNNSIVLGDGGNVDIFPPGATVPSRTFPTVDPFAFVLGQYDERLFVAPSSTSAGVGVYDFRTGRLLTSITSGLVYPVGVAYYPAAPY